jgi:putative ABC transport system ATP-binding protein
LFALDGICQHYRSGPRRLKVLSDVHLDIWPGQSCALLGPSGSGKSTLLNILGLLDRPASGRYRLDGRDVLDASADTLAAWRNRQFGFVFQGFNLLPRLSAWENVGLALTYRGVSRAKARLRALTSLAQVGLADRVDHYPADLSGGQRQRVAIARALVGEPAVILADEPTGNLDGQTADDIMNLLLRLNRDRGMTLVLVTHDVVLAARLERQIRVEQGRLHEVTERA